MKNQLRPVLSDLSRKFCIHDYNAVKKGDIAQMNEHVAYFECKICKHRTFTLDPVFNFEF